MRQFVLAALSAAALLSLPTQASGGEPLSEWLDGLGSSAQARADGTPDAHIHARRALDARPNGDAAARATIELALAAPSGEDAAASVEHLREAIASTPRGARGAARLALGEALLRHDEPRAAAEAFLAAASDGNGALALRARWRAAEALHAAGSAAEAVAAWRSLLPEPQVPNGEAAARLAYALDLREVGEGRRASEILRSLWSAQPERPEAEEAEAALARWRERGAPIPPFTGEERIARAFRLIQVGRLERARAELALAEAARPPPPPDLLALAQANAALAAGQPIEAERAVAAAARSVQPGIRRGAAMVLARAAARTHRVSEAIAAWRAVAGSDATVPGLPAASQATLRDDAEYYAAWLPLDAGDPERAVVALERIVAVHPGSKRADDARWFAAWGLVRLGRNDRAAAALRALDDGASTPRVRYWRARIEADATRRAALLTAVVVADPLGYYGLLACARLAEQGVSCERPALAPGRPSPELASLADEPRLRQAALLAAWGFRDEAIAELSATVGSNGGRRAAPAAAELASYLGDPVLPFRVARDQLGLSRTTVAWSFPDAWPTLVGGAARGAGVDPTLLLAVMRRESGFRREIRSPAGAIGLLQIVPATAARLGALLRFPSPIADRLEEPSVNVPLGAGYLGLLQERFGNPIVALAAYNAGPGAVLRWTRDRADLPLDAWVESIPYRETRQYVRAVVENWVGMRAARGEPPPEVDPGRPIPAALDGVAF